MFEGQETHISCKYSQYLTETKVLFWNRDKNGCVTTHSGIYGGSILASQLSSWAVLQFGDSGKGKRESGENSYV